MNRNSIVALVLAYFIPGAGHFYLGHRRRAAAFFAIVISLFSIGLALDGTLYTLAERGSSILRLLASLGSLGAGAIYFIANAFGPHGDITSITYEYGSTFMLTAGLMNLLLVLDVFDLSAGEAD